MRRTIANSAQILWLVFGDFTLFVSNKFYLSGKNSARFAATRSVRETLAVSSKATQHRNSKTIKMIINLCRI
jgi:hypothetical protein